jgi:hypothetical protein
MLIYLLLEPQIFNDDTLAFKIGCLANPIKNSIYTAVLVVIVLSARLRLYARLGLLAAILNVLGAHTVLPALTNTLFTIHPPLLYICTALVIVGVISGGRRLILIYIALWAISICMGGFWSMQELSWGGWWNWDVIECGVAYQWLLASLLSHRSMRGASNALSSCYALLLSITAYTLLNKLGVGVSIHSFVSSRSVQSHYSLILVSAGFFFLLAGSPRLTAPLCWLAVLLLFYCGTRSFSILKPFLLWAIAFAPFLTYKRPTIASSHTLIYYASLSVVATNFDNSAFFYCATRTKDVVSLTCSARFWSLDITTPLRQKLIWDGLWLSKPRYSYSLNLESWALRSPSMRSMFSAFLK